eukprot:1088040-Pleurochrysis_carterae.AAC.4
MKTYQRFSHGRVTNLHFGLLLLLLLFGSSARAPAEQDRARCDTDGGHRPGGEEEPPCRVRRPRRGEGRRHRGRGRGSHPAVTPFCDAVYDVLADW